MDYGIQEPASSDITLSLVNSYITIKQPKYLVSPRFCGDRVPSDQLAMSGQTRQHQWSHNIGGWRGGRGGSLQSSSHHILVPSRQQPTTTSLTSQARTNVRSLTLSQESDFTQWRTHTCVLIFDKPFTSLSETHITSHHVLKIVTDSWRNHGCPFAKCKID